MCGEIGEVDTAVRIQQYVRRTYIHTYVRTYVPVWRRFTGDCFRTYIRIYAGGLLYGGWFVVGRARARLAVGGGCSCCVVVLSLLVVVVAPNLFHGKRAVFNITGTILNRTYGTHKNLHISLFLLTIFGPTYYGPP